MPSGVCNSVQLKSLFVGGKWGTTFATCAIALFELVRFMFCCKVFAASV